MCVGLHQMNVHVIRHATQAFAEVILAEGAEAARRGVAICYDCRNHSDDFARETACVMAGNGIPVRLFDALRPVSFRFNQNESNRIHLGLCAQDVEAALGACGVDTQDFAGFIKSPRADGGYDYALRYSEFLPLCIEQIQKLKARVDGLERSASDG